MNLTEAGVGAGVLLPLGDMGDLGDMGAGTSGRRHLSAFAVTEMKIDQSFVTRMPPDPAGPADRAQVAAAARD